MTFVRVVKRKSAAAPRDAGRSSTQRIPQRTAEMIVKSWIKESRERRQAEVNQLQKLILWKPMGGLARG